jgi:hypothetical protein
MKLLWYWDSLLTGTSTTTRQTVCTAHQEAAFHSPARHNRLDKKAFEATGKLVFEIYLSFTRKSNHFASWNITCASCGLELPTSSIGPRWSARAVQLKQAGIRIGRFTLPGFRVSSYDLSSPQQVFG